MIEKLKDIFYDKNDIIVALIILIVAGFFITRQVDFIVSYPERLAEEMQQEQQEPQGHTPPESEGGQSGVSPDVEGSENEGEGGESDIPDPTQPAEPPQSADPTQPAEPPQPETPPQGKTQPQPESTEFKTAVDRTVEIPVGSYSASIAAILSDAGVIPSRDAFLSAVTAANAETKLQAGTFYIPAGSTLSDVVAILTR